MLDAFVYAIALGAGVFFWYFYYGIECFINGAIGEWELPFRCFWQDLRCNLPFYGDRYRRTLVCGDEYPGRLHFLFTHIVLPLTPLGIAIYLLR